MDAFEPPAVKKCAGCQRADLELLIPGDGVEPPAGMTKEEMANKR